MESENQGIRESAHELGTFPCPTTVHLSLLFDAFLCEKAESGADLNVPHSNGGGHCTNEMSRITSFLILGG